MNPLYQAVDDYLALRHALGPSVVIKTGKGRKARLAGIYSFVEYIWVWHVEIKVKPTITEIFEKTRGHRETLSRLEPKARQGRKTYQKEVHLKILSLKNLYWDRRMILRFWRKHFLFYRRFVFFCGESFTISLANAVVCRRTQHRGKEVPVFPSLLLQFSNGGPKLRFIFQP
jgi:hypothetical protein